MPWMTTADQIEFVPQELVGFLSNRGIEPFTYFELAGSSPTREEADFYRRHYRAACETGPSSLSAERVPELNAHDVAEFLQYRCVDPAAFLALAETAATAEEAEVYRIWSRAAYERELAGWAE